MIEDYYANKEAEQAKEELLLTLGVGAKDVGDGVARSQRGRPISISTAPLKSAIFGKWYDQVRPLLHRRAGNKFELPDPVNTEVRIHRGPK